MEAHYEQIAEEYKLFANPIRLKIMSFLKERGEASVGEIAEYIGVSRITLSQHLVRLRRLRVVKVRRDGLGAHYQLAHPEVMESRKIIWRFYQKAFQRPFRH
jgi:DNA-binding transcriptional ArsR family regulator